VALSCPRCGADNPAGFRLCGYCGAPLTTGDAPPEVRKVVTLVFADVTGSTAMAERRDAEAVRAVILGYFEIARDVITRHGGTIEKFIGDAVMAVFGIPVVREDDPLRGVRAAQDLRDALAEFNHEQLERTGDVLQVRIGVHTGEVVAGDPSSGHAFASGDTVNLAARIEQAAPPGDVLMSESTLALVADHVEVAAVAPLTLKGKSALVPAYRLLLVRRSAGSATRRPAGPLLGRVAELRLLLGGLERARRTRSAECVAILGAPGSGKSRLIAELLDRAVDETLILRGACLSYGESATFWPLREMVEQVTGITDSDDAAAVRRRIRDNLPSGRGGDRAAELVGAVIGAGETSSSSLHETYGAFRQLLESAVTERPLLLVFDDLHWAEPPLIELVRDLATHLQVPALVVCAGRDEFARYLPRLVEDEAVIALAPLGDADSASLIAAILEGWTIDAAMRARIESAGQGNPLFLVELARKVRDDLVSPDAAPDAQSIPLTLQGLLAARLDQLGLAERRAAQRASVLGHLFWERPLAHLSPKGDSLEQAVAELVRRELVSHDPATLFGQEGLRFGHVLIREAAYSSLTKRERIDCHERYAEWLAENSGARATEYAEVLGHHFREAHLLLEQLGTDPARSRRLAKRAGEQFATAGLRALARSDERSADTLLASAVLLLGDEATGDLRYWQALAVNRSGRIRESVELWRSVAEAARHDGDRRIALYSELDWRAAAVYALGETDPDELRRLATEAIRVFAHPRDERGLGFGWLVRAWMAIIDGAGDGPSALESARLAVEHIERSGDEHLLSLALEAFAVAISQSDIAAPQAIAEIGQLLGRGVHVCEQAHFALGLLHAERGEFVQAHEIVLAAVDRAQRRGNATIASQGLLVDGLVSLDEQDGARAELRFRGAIDDCRESELRAGLANAAALLAIALGVQGRPDEALEYVRLSEETDSEGPAMRGLQASARGLALAQLADPSALGCALTGIACAHSVAAKRTIALAEVICAEIAKVLGDDAEAQAHAHVALAAYRSLENLTGERRAERVLTA
jgi:class 3 adenylate cyclase/tetratricopeptide (TPR) repeat protein